MQEPPKVCRGCLSEAQDQDIQEYGVGIWQMRNSPWGVLGSCSRQGTACKQAKEAEAEDGSVASGSCFPGAGMAGGECRRHKETAVNEKTGRGDLS